MSSILFWFWVSVGSRDWLPSGEQLVLLRRVVAGLDEESSVVSCGDDVGDLRRAFQATRLQAYPWGFVSSRINQGGGRTLSLPRSFALLQWLWLIPVVVFLKLKQCPVPLNSDLSCSACAYWCSGIYHKCSFLGFRRRWCCYWPMFWRRIECGFVLWLELVEIFRQLPCISAGATLLLQRFFPRSALQFRSRGATLMRFKVRNNRLGRTLSFPIFYVWIARRASVPRIWGPSIKSTWISVALYPGIRNPVASNFSYMATEPSPPFFFCFLLGWLSTSLCLNVRFSANLHLGWVLRFWHSGGCQLFHDGFV